MARFPRTEAEIAELASTIFAGLETGADDFPRPPIGAAALEARLEAYREALVGVTRADAAAREQRVRKREALKQLTAAMKAVLRYAEIVARKQPEKLVQFGWGPPRDPRALTPPGEVRMFRTLAEGDTWIDLTWRAPLGGGAPDAYIIERRDGPSAEWKVVKTITETERRLVDQPRGDKLSYRVRAMNEAGDGSPSATVTAVL